VTANKFEHLGAIARNSEGKMYIMRGYIRQGQRFLTRESKAVERQIHFETRWQKLDKKKHRQMSGVQNLY
jgi:hypothetical protein